MCINVCVCVCVCVCHVQRQRFLWQVSEVQLSESLPEVAPGLEWAESGGREAGQQEWSGRGESGREAGPGQQEALERQSSWPQVAREKGASQQGQEVGSEQEAESEQEPRSENESGSTSLQEAVFFLKVRIGFPVGALLSLLFICPWRAASLAVLFL